RRAVVNRGSVDAAVDGLLTRGVYNGNWRNLDLSSGDRRLFEGDDRVRVEHDMEVRLMDELSAKLADRVQPLLLQRVP
ncbi:MAG TPA: hypothetical protein VFG50_09350, partial [Rhodothermales bacterium]|nr:hypothetical protein [Rhodothermales bacterium]